MAYVKSNKNKSRTFSTNVQKSCNGYVLLTCSYSEGKNKVLDYNSCTSTIIQRPHQEIPIIIKALKEFLANNKSKYTF